MQIVDDMDWHYFPRGRIEHRCATVGCLEDICESGQWSIQFPANWKIGSCHYCSDPAKGNVFVTFSNPDRVEEFVMVEHLAPKPADETADHWLEQMSKGNSNPVTSKQTLLLDGMPALKVRNRNSSGSEFETVYVIRESETFSIELYDNKDGERIQGMSIYPIYQHMLSTFKFTGK